MSTIVITGRLAADPELVFGNSGTARAKMRVAEDRRKRQDDGTWTTVRTDWHDVVMWSKKAEHAAETLHKGDLVLIIGDLESNQTEKDGQKRTWWSINAREAGLVKAGGQGGSSGGYQRPTTQQTSQAGQGDPWGGGGTPSGGGFPGAPEEPPFRY